MSEYSTDSGLKCCPGYAVSTQDLGRIVHKESERRCDTVDCQGDNESNDIKETER